MLQEVGVVRGNSALLEGPRPWEPANGVGPAELDTDTEAEVFEGTVRLDVEIAGHIRLAINFVSKLRHDARLRLLRLVGDPPNDMGVWLGLREPVRIKQMLEGMEEVSHVGVIPGGSGLTSLDRECVLKVRLI